MVETQTKSEKEPLESSPLIAVDTDEGDCYDDLVQAIRQIESPGRSVISTVVDTIALILRPLASAS
jgi:hypothetical protein